MKIPSDQDTPEITVTFHSDEDMSEQEIQKHTLSGLDRTFAADPDPFLAIEILWRALAANLPTPPVVAGSVKPRLWAILTGQAKTLDAVLGSPPVRGRHSALSRRRERERWDRPLLRLNLFVSLGASIDNAALLVAREFHVGEERLARKYRALNWGEHRKWFGECLRQYPEFVERLLAEYPDDPVSRAVKDPIRASLPR